MRISSAKSTVGAQPSSVRARRLSAHSVSTSAMVASGPHVTGLVIMPASERLTMST